MLEARPARLQHDLTRQPRAITMVEEAEEVEVGVSINLPDPPPRVAIPLPLLRALDPHKAPRILEVMVVEIAAVVWEEQELVHPAWVGVARTGGIERICSPL